MAKMLLSTIVLLVVIAGMDAAQPEASRENLRRLLTDHFTTPRHHVTNPDGLVKAENFIYDTWKSYHMQVGKQVFNLEKNGETFTGVNVLGYWPGRFHMTTSDRAILLTAHYESLYNMPGVEDNGSGLAALMEIARVVTSQPCMQDYSIAFTAFDFAENDMEDSPCSTSACGCRAFLELVREALFDGDTIPSDGIQGAIVLDGLLNYNNTPGAQQIPFEDAFQTIPGFVDTLNAIRADNYRGNFVGVISREVDSPLAAAFNRKFDEAGSPLFKRHSLALPFYNITDETRQDPLWPLYIGIIDTDIRAFYELIPDVKALFITDTLAYRGREKDWSSLTPYDAMTITDDRLEFLKKATDAVTRLVLDLAGRIDAANCPDPMLELPDTFQPGYQMKGSVMTSGSTRQNISLLVHSVLPHGGINATLSAKSWSLQMAGIYDPVEQNVYLHLPEPFTLPGAPYTMSCRVKGRFHLVKRGVTIIGIMRGYCGRDLYFTSDGPDDGRGDIYLRGRPGSRPGRNRNGPDLALPVVLSLLGGMLLSAAVAVALWHVYKRHLSNETANSLPNKEGQ